MPSIPHIGWERPPRAGLISVVTVVRNDRQGLKRTLEGLARQEFESFEHVVVDGASTDGTVDLLQQWQAHPTTANLRAWLRPLWLTLRGHR